METNLPIPVIQQRGFIAKVLFRGMGTLARESAIKNVFVSLVNWGLI